MSEYIARPYILAETTWKKVKETEFKVAVLPWGATEAHNYHLPYATDNYQADFIAAGAAKIAWESGAKPIVLPCIPFGVNTGQIDIKLCMNLNPSTQMEILKDVCHVLTEHKIEKLVILNGHGGNSFKQMSRELSLLYPKVFVSIVNWYHATTWSDYFEDLGDHAGEMETSVMMHIAPQFCRPVTEAGDGHARKWKIDGFNQGWASSQRQWSKVTKDTGVGNPYKATAEKGKKCLDETISKIGNFLIDLDKADLNNMYQ